MKTLIALPAVLIALPAFAHNSTVPHVHPHESSMLPDYAVMLFAAAIVAAGIAVIRIWRKG